MSRQRFSTLMVLVLMVTQILGPAILWAAEQRGVQIEANERVLISAMSEGSLTAEAGGDSRTVTFGDAVIVGEELRTGKDTVAEVLIGNRAVVTLGEATAAQVSKLSHDQLTIQVSQGMVRVAASANALGEKGTVSIQTPTSEVKTRGGIVRVMVNTTRESVAQAPVGEAKPYLASYTPHAMVAANNVDTDIIQVEEGLAEVLGAGPDGEALAVISGQRVTRQAGQAGLLTAGEQSDTMRASVLAKADHNITPKEGVDNLVALQVDQATQLGQVLTGASKVETQEADKKDSRENPVNGATGGVQVATNNQSSNAGNPSNPTNPPSVVATLFGGGNASNSTTANPTESTGTGFGGNNNNGFGTVSAGGVSVKVNGGENALLVFTRKDPVQSIVIEDNEIDASEIDQSKISSLFPFSEVPGKYLKDLPCTEACLWAHLGSSNFGNVRFDPLPSVTSQFTVAKELVLVGGTANGFHGGIAPTETLIARGGAPQNVGDPPITNLAPPSIPGFFPTDRFPANIGLFRPTPPEIASANSTFVVETDSTFSLTLDALVGGTLGQFSNDPTPSPNGIAIDQLGSGVSHVDGAITATGADVVLTGGVTLDRETVATIGTTVATDNYFSDPIHNIPGAETFTGSLLAVIDGPNNISTAVTVEDRLLGVYDGSQILTPAGDGNKALLSVLDAKLKGPNNGAPLIDINAAFKDADPDMTNGRDATGGRPNVRVTSAVVTRSTKALPTIPLDSGLLEASAPILALTMADMTTTSHFAGVVGKFDDINNRPLSLKLNDVMVALNASNLMIENGNLLNLNNATATLGYLFSLNNASTLKIGVGEGNGTLFSLANGAELNLTANALGVFGGGSNTLAIKNDLCAGACGNLVNTAGEAFKLPNGSTLQAAGVTQDVVLPDGFNPFALAGGAPTPNITVEGALFEVKDGSTLNISGTTVVGAPGQ